MGIYGDRKFSYLFLREEMSLEGLKRSVLFIRSRLGLFFILFVGFVMLDVWSFSCCLFCILFFF